ncbi:MAG: class I SAM-dependent methyltransferase, partial [Holophagales bacterium]|nr:class I SAM-dependent methyltransferase [Holophagales bacterium]
MPTLRENHEYWNAAYDWAGGGDEWSESWGSTALLWHCTLLPRIQHLLPAGNLLEIAPGFGRWSQYLQGHCRRLVLVDLAERCIRGCQERFAGLDHIEYHVNDGRTLEAVADGSVDLAFS